MIALKLAVSFCGFVALLWGYLFCKKTVFVLNDWVQLAFNLSILAAIVSTGAVVWTL